MGPSGILIGNREELEAACGGWPCFHDAEVLWLELDRQGPSLEMRVRVSGRSAEKIGSCSVPGHNVMVTLGFGGASRVELSGFNEQNVLAGLRFVDDVEGTRVLVDGIYGLTGSFLCSSIEVRQVAEIGKEAE